MFLKKNRGSEKLRFQHYVVLGLSANIHVVLESKTSSKNYSEIYKNFVELLQSETFIIACMIGAHHPDIITGIFKQNDEDCAQLIEMTRNCLSRIIKIREQKGELNLNDLASLFIRPEKEIFSKGDLVKGLTTKAINKLSTTFLFGYIFGHDYPQRFLEMLEKRFQETNKTGPNIFAIVGMVSVYAPLIEEDDRSFFWSTGALDRIQLAYDNGTLPQRLVRIHQNIASKLVKDYELTISPLK